MNRTEVRTLSKVLGAGRRCRRCCRARKEEEGREGEGVSESRKQTCEEGRGEDVCMIRGREGETIRVRYYSRAPEVEI